MLPDRSRGLPMLAHAADGSTGAGSAPSARTPTDDEAERKRQIGAILDQADRELAAGVGPDLADVQRQMRERLRAREAPKG